VEGWVHGFLERIDIEPEGEVETLQGEWEEGTGSTCQTCSRPSAR
jgi:hypothetical protein